MESMEMVESIKEKMVMLASEMDDYSVKKRKVSGKRARKITLELTEMFKKFRKQSVIDSSSETFKE